jgi:radical SAM protein with 4Fe4S-binding SPASM domain
MYSLDEICAEAETFRAAVQDARPFRPLSVKLKIIPRCNLHCEMCNHWRRPYGDSLSSERLRHLFAELADLGCRKLHLSGGEPLLRPDTPDLIAHASALGMRVNMTTNGTLVNKDMAKRLIQAGLRSVNVSLDSPDRKTHEKVRGTPHAWKKTTHAIAYFARWHHKGKLAIRVNTVVNRINYTTLQPLPDLVADLGATSLNLIGVDDHCGEYLSLSRRHIEQYNATIAPTLAHRALALGLMAHEDEAYPFGRDPRHIRHSKRGRFAMGWYRYNPCFAPWTHALIDYNGDVYPCCMMRERIPPLGNIREQPFAAVWESQRYQGIRQAMHPPAFAACARCDDFITENKRMLAIVTGAGEEEPAHV